MSPADTVCGGCATANPLDAAFCGQCGVALTDPAPLARAERKTVTVVFIDLVGFTARAELLDPEDVRVTLSRYYLTVREDLERYGGTVEKFIGDAVMACFGAPLAHEDDPERAIRAAFAVQRALQRLSADDKQPLQVRIGVHTGEAVVDPRVHPATEGMVSGDVVAIAARLQEGAPAGGILVSDTTRRATAHAIQYGAQWAIEVSGALRAVTAWEATGLVPRGARDTEQAGYALIGREPELAYLRESFQRVVREPVPRLVTLLGAAGIGKSRLVWELWRYVEDLPDILVPWREARCLSYGEGVTFWALGEIVKAQAGIVETDSVEVTRDKLAAAVAGLLPSSEAVRVVQQLAPLVGLPGEAGATPAEATKAWVRLLYALGRTRPAVVVIEDLHWADDGLLDVIDALVHTRTASHLLVIATARPELLDRRPDWGGAGGATTVITLPPLTERETRVLITGLLAGAPLAPGALDRLRELSGGNPLFAEEWVRMLVDTGVLRRVDDRWRLDDTDDLPLPESLQAVLGARLDALPVDEKSVLQDAAVLGKEFAEPALRRLSGLSQPVLDQILRSLERRELIRQLRATLGSDREYAFRHILVRDAAYARIPRGARAQRHVATAEWLEGIATGRGEETAELVAHHWLAALDGAPDPHSAAAWRDSARRALFVAGERACQLNALPRAETLLGRALELWPPDVEPARRRAAVIRHAEAAQASGH